VAGLCLETHGFSVVFPEVLTFPVFGDALGKHNVGNLCRNILENGKYVCECVGAHAERQRIIKQVWLIIEDLSKRRMGVLCQFL
jgi:hypothetical protein